MLKFLLLVVLFMIFKKDLFEGMESSEESGSSSTGSSSTGSSSTGSSSTGSTSTGSSSTGSSSTGSSSRNARLTSMSDTIEEDEKIFTYLIGGGIGFAIGIACGIIYHVVHTEDTPSS